MSEIGAELPTVCGVGCFGGGEVLLLLRYGPVPCATGGEGGGCIVTLAVCAEEDALFILGLTWHRHRTKWTTYLPILERFAPPPAALVDYLPTYLPGGGLRRRGLPTYLPLDTRVELCRLGKNETLAPKLADR